MKKYINLVLLALSAIIAVVSGILFNVVSTTGFLAGQTYNVGVTVMAIVAGVLIGISIFSRFFGEKVAMLLQLAGVVLLAICFVQMLMDKAGFLGDAFIPMERTSDFHAGIAMTYASLIMLGVSAIVLAAAAFVGNNEKK